MLGPPPVPADAGIEARYMLLAAVQLVRTKRTHHLQSSGRDTDWGKFDEGDFSAQNEGAVFGLPSMRSSQAQASPYTKPL